MYKYTICFIQRGDKILMLNRENPVWMGIWNGVGGKIEKGETPLEGVLREVKEETGIELDHAEYKGTVTWSVDDSYIGGMYAFVAQLPETYDYYTPIKTDEGILDWKDISWVLHPENLGMANLKYFLKTMLSDSHTYDHRFKYRNGEVIDFKSEILDTTIFL
ncbi:NUDIX hydrolase [Heyndrickxia sp. NPDC080065]|uniref:NUDIX hydrolase n=1 Tax=Heyndrickxia sp. NPDC080065 TaxID=3390568 RepID=UPI003D0505AC